MTSTTRQSVRRTLANIGLFISDTGRTAFGRLRDNGYCYSVKLIKPLRVYKKVYIYPLFGYKRHALATLELPVGTIIVRGEAYDNKLRADRAKVIRIIDLISGKAVPEAYSGYANSARLKYAVGTVVKPKRAFAKSLKTCGSGIHFFLDKKRAEHY